MTAPSNAQRRVWVAGTTLALLVSGMAFSLWWAPVVRHHSYWLTPGDLWDSFRNAHWVATGGLSFVYGAGTGLVTLPGLAVLLAPVAAISSALGLSESVPAVALLKPQAWLLLGPFTFLTAGVGIAGLDRLAASIGVSWRARRLLMVCSAAALWPTLVMWGHPEDVLAIGLAAYALAMALEQRFSAAGWLLGLALAMQLFVVLIVPVLVAVVGMKRVAPLVARASLAPGFLLVAVLVPNFRGSIDALWNQPNYPTVDHATPWVLMAPKVGRYAVAAGPGRIISLALALALGLVAVKVRKDPRLVVWLAAAALAGRCLFESVMVPYYVMPVVALCLVVAATSVWRWRQAASVVMGGLLTVVVFWHFGMWPYWSVMAALTVAMLVAIRPGRRLENLASPSVSWTAGRVDVLRHLPTPA